MTETWQAVNETYSSTLVDLAAKNTDIFVVEADLMKASGTKTFMERYPDRHVNVGVAEQNLVGVSAGIAATGRIPFACTMANFMSQRACDQVAMSVAFNKFNVKLVGCYAGLTQEKNGGTHISVMDIAVMRCLPNMKVVVPGDCREFAQAVAAICSEIGPVYVRMPKLLPGLLFDESYRFQIGKGIQICDGKDLTIVSTGITTSVAIQAIRRLEEEGIASRVIHLSTLKPADEKLIAKSARETKGIITVENHSIYGGLGSLVTEIVSRDCPVPVERIGFPDQFGLTANLDYQMEYFGLTIENILKKANILLKRKR